jgi:hypothetical protein
MRRAAAFAWSLVKRRLFPAKTKLVMPDLVEALAQLRD